MNTKSLFNSTTLTVSQYNMTYGEQYDKPNCVILNLKHNGRRYTGSFYLHDQGTFGSHKIQVNRSEDLVVLFDGLYHASKITVNGDHALYITYPKQTMSIVVYEDNDIPQSLMHTSVTLFIKNITE